MGFVKTGDEGRIMKIIKAEDGANEIVEVHPGSSIEELKEKKAEEKTPLTTLPKEDNLRGRTAHVCFLDDVIKPTTH